MLTITPTFSFVPPLKPELPSPCTVELHSLQSAAQGDILGIILGHGAGPQYPSGSVSEYLCAIVANGDGRSCDGAFTSLKSGARAAVRALKTSWFRSHRPASYYLTQLGWANGPYETMHFKTFTVAVAFKAGGDRGPGALTAVHVLMHAEPTPDVAGGTIAQLQALFDFLRGINPHYQYYTIELPAPIELSSMKMTTLPAHAL
ncbi:hypothetical protein T8T21_16100 (plasmid) [Limimaricola variabilis]|uniref:hypothetical protein n=1 Tax=Limimaricola variabilis TaxID=1492771 RepID=UPI002AC960CE|nr:hypothetical protein [Limimaricola variabilis]WPY96295.1 hypothetical protein T8T21_16100 [Limimaricola variabilis]